MTRLAAEDLSPSFGSEVRGFTQDLLDDPGECAQLQNLFDDRGLLVFRDLEFDHASQMRMAEILIQRDLGPGTPREDRWYISNKREKSAAPFGRLQFHADMMWSEDPCHLVSLYAIEVEPPVSPTTFVSTTRAWAALPDDLRSRAEHRGGDPHCRRGSPRGDMTDVILTTVDNPPTTVKPLCMAHPRTTQTLLYACEQMTREIVGLDGGSSEAMLEELFNVLYDEDTRVDHHWETGDFVVWDNLAVQHGRSNVGLEGPARTLRKVAAPLPVLRKDELPVYSTTTS